MGHVSPQLGILDYGTSSSRRDRFIGQAIHSDPIFASRGAVIELDVPLSRGGPVVLKRPFYLR